MTHEEWKEKALRLAFDYRNSMASQAVQARYDELCVHLDKVPIATSHSLPDDSWIPWAGGECPVAKDAKVEIRFRDGAGNTTTDKGVGNDYDWTSYGQYADILAYRIRK